MALFNRVGNLLKRSVTSNPSLYQAIRCMSSSKVFVGGLSYGTDDQSLREAFTSFGEVVEARVILDRDTGRSRGFGFVAFTSGEEASAAISGMDGKDLHGRMVRVNYATDRTGGFRGGYGGGGGYSGSGYGGSSGGYGGGGGYGGNTGGYGNVGGSNSTYGGNIGGYSATAGGPGGGGASGENFASSGGFAGYDGSGSMGYGNNANKYSSSGGAYGDGSQDALLEDNFKDDDDEPDDYANKRG